LGWFKKKKKKKAKKKREMVFNKQKSTDSCPDHLPRIMHLSLKTDKRRRKM
jgi:hypothetical protein